VVFQHLYLRAHDSAPVSTEVDKVRFTRAALLGPTVPIKVSKGDVAMYFMDKCCDMELCSLLNDEPVFKLLGYLIVVNVQSLRHFAVGTAPVWTV
jgi:hypothetical protein